MAEDKRTVELAAVPPWAVDLTSSVKRMASNVEALVEDGKGMNVRVAGIEGRLARLESPTSPPPPPLTSERVRAVIEEHPSQMDLEHHAKLAQALMDLGEERSKREALEKNAATKDDLKAITEAQTSDIVASVATLAEKSPTIRMLLAALAGLIFGAISAASTYLAARGH